MLVEKMGTFATVSNLYKNRTQSMLGTITRYLKNACGRLQTAFEAFCNNNHIDEPTLKELETTLLKADVGVTTSRYIIDQVKKNYHADSNATLRDTLTTILVDILKQPTCIPLSDIILLVGVNGTGKTTVAAKLAAHKKSIGKQPLLIAADTFRAAATEQLTLWAEKIGIDIHSTIDQQPPASVVFTGLQKLSANDYNTAIIDTAGRLHTHTNLMNELIKIRRVIDKETTEKSVTTLLTIDATLGQSSVEQAKLFTQAMNIDGIIITKTDSSSSGGTIFAIAHELNIPIVAISFGEQLEDWALFNPDNFVHNLFEKAQ